MTIPDDFTKLTAAQEEASIAFLEKLSLSELRRRLRLVERAQWLGGSDARMRNMRVVESHLVAAIGSKTPLPVKRIGYR
jgi:predicted DCC family thiol-disulfide oxidoreductase YuxK